jgi:sec-independent protein translocase protein TatA
MGMPGWKELLIILLVVLVVFGAKKLKTIGSDLGGAIRGFKKSMNEGDEDERAKQLRHGEPDAQFDAESDTETKPADKRGGGRPA